MSTPQTRRQEWMKLLALADTDRLRAAWDELPARPDYRIARGPETGLIMVRARAGNAGVRFNLGEMSVTRCSVVLEEGIMGHAWVAGGRPEHARLAALFDALLQNPSGAEALDTTLIEPLRQVRAAHLASRLAEVRPSRVDFFTMVRGED